MIATGRGDTCPRTFRPSAWACSVWSNSLRHRPSALPPLGARVRARYLASRRGKQGTRWYAGRVSGWHDDGTCSVTYDDGDVESGVKPAFVKLDASRSVPDV